jgi:hypothetical protein
MTEKTNVINKRTMAMIAVKSERRKPLHGQELTKDGEGFPDKYILRIIHIHQDFD